MGISQRLYRKAKTILPGGTQLLSKRPELFLPDLWPAYYAKAKGCEVWDLDGKKYVDMCYMGIGACVLGYADPDVNRAVRAAVDMGSASTLNAPEEVKLAELLVSLHPWADMVRYARSGGEAMAIAVRIARAKSRRDNVLFCGYHGWHDWYLASNLADRRSLDGHLLPGLNPLGVPRALKGTSFPFAYNDTAGFQALVKKHSASIGAIVLESIRNADPEPGFFKAVGAAARRYGIPLVADEISAGFRLNAGGAHLLYHLKPDIAVFAKAMGNGYPIAAVIGKRAVMEVAQDTFISSTNWTEKIGPAAALATIGKFKARRVAAHLVRVGKTVQQIWERTAERHGLPIQVGGIPPLGHFQFEHPQPLVLKTLFTQEMLKAGFLASTAFYSSFAHKAVHLTQYAAAADRAFAFIARAVAGGRPERSLAGPVCQSGFKRLT